MAKKLTYVEYIYSVINHMSRHVVSELMTMYDHHIDFRVTIPLVFDVFE